MNGEVRLLSSIGSAEESVTTILRVKRRYQKGTLTLKHGAWYARVEAVCPTTSSDSSRRKQSWVRLGSHQDWPSKDDAYPHFIRFMQLVNDELMTSDSPRLLTFIERVYFPN